MNGDDLMTRIDAEIRAQGAVPPALVYLGSPYAGQGESRREREADTDRNVRFALLMAEHIASLGWTPIVPHLMLPRYLDDSIPAQRELGLLAGRRLMMACAAAIFFIPPWRDGPSEGMKAEIDAWRSRPRLPLVFPVTE